MPGYYEPVAHGASHSAGAADAIPGMSTVALASTAPAAPAVVAAVGVGTTAARADHVHPKSWYSPEDFGYVGFTFPPDITNSAGAAITSGTLYMYRMHVAQTFTAAGIDVYVSAAGSTLTAGQSFACLFSPAKVLLGQTADLSGVWNSTGQKGTSMGLTAASAGSLTALPPGDYFVGLWSVGTTPPAFRSGSLIAISNGRLSQANSKYATADTGLTTTAPSPAGALTGISAAAWVAIY